MKLLAKRPDDRYASAEDLRADLNRFLAGETTVAERGLVAAGAARGRSCAGRSGHDRAGRHHGRRRRAGRRRSEDDEPEERKRRTWLFIAVLVVLLAMLGGLLFWFTRSLDEGELVTVPPVVGLQFEDAKTALEDVGLEVEVSREPSDSMAVGLVISQDPTKDDEVEEGLDGQAGRLLRSRGGRRCPTWCCSPRRRPPRR